MNRRTDFARIELVLLGSYFAVGIGAVLPWISAGVAAGPADVGPTATGIEGFGIVTFALAIVAIAVQLLADVDDLTPVSNAAIGAVVLLVGLWRMIDLGGPVSPGVGFYLTVLGGLAITGVGAWTYRLDGDRSTPEATR